MPYASHKSSKSESCCTAFDPGGNTALIDSILVFVNTFVNFSIIDRSNPNASSSPCIASNGTFSNLSTSTHVAANLVSGTPNSVNTSAITPRELILIPTSSADNPTLLKNVTMALSNSASASMFGIPQISIFH